MAAPKRQLPLLRQRTILRYCTEGVRVVREDTPVPLPGYLCESCLDAPAIAVVPAPWGGEMGACRACQRRRSTQRDA